MKGFGLILILIVLVIIAYLTVRSYKKKATVDFEKATGIEMPEKITDLPSQYEKKLKDALKKGEDRTDKALEGLE